MSRSDRKKTIATGEEKPTDTSGQRDDRGGRTSGATGITRFAQTERRSGAANSARRRRERTAHGDEGKMNGAAVSDGPRGRNRDEKKVRQTNSNYQSRSDEPEEKRMGTEQVV